MSFYERGRKCVRYHGTSFWRQTSAYPSTFPVFFPSHRFEEFSPGCSKSLSELLVLVLEIADLSIAYFVSFIIRNTCIAKIYSINLVHISPILIIFSPDRLLVRINLVNCFQFLDSYFECSRNSTVPAVNLLQIRVANVSPVLPNCSE